MNEKKSTKQHLAFQQELNNLETTIAALEAHRSIVGDIVADTALDLLRERLATLVQPSQAADERKRVTVLFADVSGYTALSENLDPEDVASIMNRLFEAVTIEIHRYGGTVDKYSGDAVMALFGAPQALENHEEMAVRAAMAMQTVIREFSADLEKTRGFQVQMRIGLNTGEVLAGLVGGLQARSYTVMGDTVNLAARLESAAPVAGILASAETTRSLHAIFDFEPPQQITVKGKSEPITVYVVVGEKAERGRVRGISGLHAPMVGREKEFAGLQTIFAEALTEKVWRATAVTGEAGLGKSRLQREFVAWIAQEHPDTRILTSRCYTHTRTTPYFFISGLLRNLFNINPTMETETAVSQINAHLQQFNPAATETEIRYQLGSIAGILSLPLADDPMETLAPEQRRDRTFLSLERILLGASDEQPLLILIDDLHWADVLSLEFLDRILQLINRNQIKDHAAHFFIMSRPAEDPMTPLGNILTQLIQTPHRTFRLTALDNVQSETLVSALLGQQMPEQLLQLINERAQGNPFYVEEVLRSFIEDGTLQQEASGWHIAQDMTEVQVPESVKDIIAARIDRLPPENKRITQRAAIIGRTFWQHLLTDIAKVETAEPTLMLLELRHLAERMNQSQIAEDWEWVFHHVLIQEVAYTTVPKATRRTVHQQVAQALEEQLSDSTTFLYPLIAYHYEKGNQAEKAITYLTKAGQQAAAQFANDDAVTYFNKALSLLDAQSNDSSDPHILAQKYNVILGRLDIYHLTSNRDAEKADLVTLQNLADKQRKPQHQAEVNLRYASYNEAMSDYPASVIAARQAVRWSEKAHKPSLKVDALLAWSLGLIRQGNFEKAKSLAQEAIAISKEALLLSSEATGLAYVGLSDYYLQNMEEAQQALEESLFIAQSQNDLHRQSTCFTNLVGIYHALGDYAKAKDYCEEALSIAVTSGHRAYEATILNNLGGMYHALGSLPLAQEHMIRALELAQATNNKLGESLAATNLSLVLHDLNNPDSALMYAEHAHRIDRSIGDKEGEGYSLTALALAYEGGNNWAAAFNAHNEALTIRKNIGQEACAIDNIAGLARASQQQDNLIDAQRFVDQAFDWILSNGAGGIEYPLRVLLTCATIYALSKQTAKSQEAINIAKDLLEKRAARISDEAARQSFLENVPLHQELHSFSSRSELA